MTLDRFAAVPRQARSVMKSLTSLDQSTPDGSPWRVIGRALTSLWRARRDIVRFLRTGDPAVAHDLRRRFGIGEVIRAAHPIPGTLFACDAPPKPQPATIIIPIFNAAEHVERLLSHLPDTLPAHQHVILIDDGSTDARIAPLIDWFCRTWPNSDGIALPNNEGFVTAANTALDHMPSDHHAILLNSDALPPQNWIPRLLAPFSQAADIASVTPLSNNAEILSVPQAGVEGKPDAAMIAHMDAVAQQLGPRHIALPTGVGFCMAMRRQYLDRLGGFDPRFGRGYGEEVDWCRRAIAVGGRNVVVTNLVVGHDGCASFGAKDRRRRVTRAAGVLNRRYPDFECEVTAWQHSDPIAPERLAVALAWASQATDAAVPVFVAHSLGGGAEMALEREVASGLASGLPSVVVLRVGGRSAWQVNLIGETFSLAGDVDDTDLMVRLLAPLTKREVIYSCGVGAADPVALPATLCRLSKGHRLTLRMHDFFPISPSWNLIGGDGRYAGVPPLETTDPAHAVSETATQQNTSHRGWRREWARAIEAADEVTVFDVSGRALIEAAYPQARDNVVLRPHKLHDLPRQVPGGGATLGVLGGINRAKGGDVLERLAHLSARRIVLIGELDGRFRLPAPHLVHGRYAQGEIADLTLQYDIGAWFLPSIWPETFSFATHEMLATGLPVASFNLGAQATTLNNTGRGHVLNLDPRDTAAIAAQLEAMFSA